MNLAGLRPFEIPDLVNVDWFGEGLSAEQHALRKRLVTSSKIMRFLNLSPYDSAKTVWRREMGLEPPLTDSPGMEMGRALEPIIGHWGAKELHNRYGYPREQLRLVKPPTVVHPRFPWWGASADFLLPERGEGIEVKVQAPHMAREYGGQPTGHFDNELVPLNHLVQVLWQMGCYQALYPGRFNTWYLAVYFGGGHRRLYRILKDDNSLAQLTDRAYSFWLKHLDPHGPQEEPSDAGWEPGDKPKPRPKVNWEHIQVPFREVI